MQPSERCGLAVLRGDPQMGPLLAPHLWRPDGPPTRVGESWVPCAVSLAGNSLGHQLPDACLRDTAVEVTFLPESLHSEEVLLVHLQYPESDFSPGCICLQSPPSPASTSLHSPQPCAVLGPRLGAGPSARSTGTPGTWF